MVEIRPEITIVGSIQRTQSIGEKEDHTGKMLAVIVSCFRG